MMRIKAIRDQKVVAKSVKRTAYKRRRPELVGQELSGVPVDGDVSHGAGNGTMLCQMMQEVLAVMQDAPTTAPPGV